MRRLSGQTLIELLVVLGVVAIGLFAAVSIVYSNLSLVERDTDEVIAINIAREGIELAKNTRDTNWLNGLPFDSGLISPSDPNDFTGTPVWDGIIAQPSVDFTANDFTDPTVNIVLVPSVSSSTMYANANAAASIAGQATLFKRLLVLHPICADASNIQTVLSSGKCADTGQTKVGIRIESHLKWTRRGIAKDFVMYDDLYDWK